MPDLHNNFHTSNQNPSLLERWFAARGCKEPARAAAAYRSEADFRERERLRATVARDMRHEESTTQQTIVVQVRLPSQRELMESLAEPIGELIGEAIKESNSGRLER